jgi:hypothetical protein
MKQILVLDGISAGKTAFVEIVKTNGYWCWNLNSRNVLSMISHKIGWNGVRNKEYYDFLAKFEELANEYFDFENWYIHDMIQKFQQDKKVQVLIIHNCKEELRKVLSEEYINSQTILITDTHVSDDTYDFTLNYKDENYNNNILALLKEVGE